MVKKFILFILVIISFMSCSLTEQYGTLTVYFEASEEHISTFPSTSYLCKVEIDGQDYKVEQSNSKFNNLAYGKHTLVAKTYNAEKKLTGISEEYSFIVDKNNIYLGANIKMIGDGSGVDEKAYRSRDTNYPYVECRIIPTGKGAAADPGSAFFSVKHLSFTAIYNGKTVDFRLEDYSVPGLFVLAPVEDGSDLSIFTGHTMQITMVWLQNSEKESDKLYNGFYEEALDTARIDVLGGHIENGFEIPAKSNFEPRDGVTIGIDIKEGYASFKEVKIMDAEGITYYTWTNPY